MGVLKPTGFKKSEYKSVDVVEDSSSIKIKIPDSENGTESVKKKKGEGKKSGLKTWHLVWNFFLSVFAVALTLWFIYYGPYIQKIGRNALQEDDPLWGRGDDKDGWAGFMEGVVYGVWECFVGIFTLMFTLIFPKSSSSPRFYMDEGYQGDWFVPASGWEEKCTEIPLPMNKEASSVKLGSSTCLLICATTNCEYSIFDLGVNKNCMEIHPDSFGLDNLLKIGYDNQISSFRPCEKN